MVKADFSRDYYGDLELAPTADLNEIKKQFKKLALLHHPDRNPGRENEVIAKFQKIQSAHEVLTDVAERAKYDANRVRSTPRYQSGGNQRGNPWSHVSSQYPAPPKPFTARNRPPPPSAGAQRYKNFETPKQSANQSAQEGAEARRSTYEAWENMRNNGSKNGGQPWSTSKPPPQSTPKSGREESNAFKHPPPPKAAPGYEEFRANYSPGTSSHRRAQSTSAFNRKGFMPNTPGGDEPAAPKGAYSTSRNKPTVAPEPPPRRPFPPQPPPNTPNPNVDPLQQFRNKANVPYEPRLSTPYATHGGEKLNPFESANMNRSKSTREPRDRDASNHMPRAGSDSNLNSPQRAQSQSFNQSSRPQRPTPSYAVPNLESDSSSDTGPEIKGRSRAQGNESRRFAKAKSSTKAGQPNNSAFSPAPPSSQKRDGANGETTGGPSTGSGQANQQENGENPSIFNFKVDENAFQRTNSNGFSSSTENINTKFTPEEWEGKFEAGYFQPEQKAANMSHQARTRAQSATRSRGRSPVKSRPTPVDSHYAQPQQPEPNLAAESPGGTKFSQNEWAGTFKPQTFMPPPAPPAATGKIPPRSARKSRGSTIRPTMGGNAAVVDDSSDSPNEKPLFTGRESFATASATPTVANPPSPDAMDVDTPPVFKPATPTPRVPPQGLGINTSPPKRPAAPSQSTSPTDQEALKVNFEDLKIQDIISSMNLPVPPTAPKVPQAPNEHVRPSPALYQTYLMDMAQYMKDWDLFKNRIMLHLVARKNQNDGLGTKRWLDSKGLETYRQGLKEDNAVLEHLVAAQNNHGNILMAHAVIRERMKDHEERERPRKKAA